MTIYPNVSGINLALFADAGISPALLLLYQSIAAPLSVSTKLSDFTEANYSGYAPKTIAAMNAPYLDPAGGATISTPSQQFDFEPPVPPALAVTNVIFGWYLANPGSGLLVCGSFDEPIAMAAVGDAIPLQVLMNFGRN